MSERGEAEWLLVLAAAFAILAVILWHA